MAMYSVKIRKDGELIEHVVESGSGCIACVRALRESGGDCVVDVESLLGKCGDIVTVEVSKQRIER